MRSIYFVLLGFLLLSCNTRSEEVKMEAINNSWHKNKKTTFTYSVKDAEITKNIIFVVRNNNDYPYSNIRFIVEFEELKSKQKNTDTLNYILANPQGEWLGTGFGETKEILFQYKMNYHFKKNGTYKISLTQAMRNDVLPGIEDVGIKIEPAKP